MFQSTICAMIFHLCAIFLVYILTAISIQAEPLIGENVTKVEKGKYSYVVSIARRNDTYHEEKAHICTGVLITKEFVLTAAHCFDKYLLGEIRVIVGSVDLREGRKYDPSMWITYDQWAKDNKFLIKHRNNDIAVIKLSKKVSRKIARPAFLSSKENKDLYNKEVVIAGWGMTNESVTKAARYMHEAKVKILPNADCQLLLWEITQNKSPVSDRYMCTKNQPNVFITKGDSGAAVLKKNYVVAISVGTCPKTVECDLPEEIINSHKINLHVSIHFYRQFIGDILKNY